jgi:hypothetical protein
MSSEYEYEYRPQSGLSTKSSRACSLLAVPRTRTRTRWLFDGYLSVMLPFIAMSGHHRPCAGGATTGSYHNAPPKISLCWGKAPTRRKVNSGGGLVAVSCCPTGMNPVEGEAERRGRANRIVMELLYLIEF